MQAVREQEKVQVNREDALEALEAFLDRYETQKQGLDALGISESLLSLLRSGDRAFSQELADKLGISRKDIKIITYRRKRA